MKYALTEDFENILGITIPERGRNAMVRCPLHEDRSPSLSLELDRGLFMCFSCGQRGTIHYLAALLDVSIDAADIALKTFDREPVSIEPPDFREKALELHQRALDEKPFDIIRYIFSRGLSTKVFRKFKLGWDGERISMPYFDGENVIGIKYRYPDGHKTNEPGTQRFIYNVNDIREANTIFLCEGESDTQALWSQPLDNFLPVWDTVGIAGVPGVGKGLPSQWTWELWLLNFIKAKRVFIAFDADTAGDEGAQIPMDILGDKAIRIRPTLAKDLAGHFMEGGTVDQLGLA